MRIGIDARFLTHPQRGGFKTYTQNLINAITEIDHENQYVIYVDRQPQNEILPSQQNIIYKVIPGTLPLVGMPIREQLLLRIQIARDNLDIVHFLCNTGTVRLNCKYIIMLHDTIQLAPSGSIKITTSLGWYKQWWMKIYSRWAILKSTNRASRIITVSNYEKCRISSELDISFELISVTHLAPNPVFAPIRKSIEIPSEIGFKNKFGLKRKYILGVGYEPRKNIPLLIEAFSHVVRNRQDIDLVIVSAHEKYRSLFKDHLKMKNLSDKATVLGAIAAEDLLHLYQHAEVFVYPSERESFGLPPLEAIACGTPTIAMNMSSLPEILQDGALFVDSKEPAVWAKAIEQVFSNEKLRAELREKGLKRAAEFSWQKCARETIKVYHQVSEERSNIV